MQLHKHKRCGQLGLARGQIRPSRQNFGRQKTKCKSTSPLTISNTVTKLYSADNGEKKLKNSDRKENWFPWTICNTWTQFTLADNLDSNAKRWT